MAVVVVALVIVVVALVVVVAKPSIIADAIDVLRAAVAMTQLLD